MKGLLIKDFKLMKMQKNFFFVIVVVAIATTAFYDDVSFPIGFLPVAIPMFTISTISYDEFDNGNAFLFTLPISHRSYVVEKYCFGLLLGCGAWIFTILLSIVVNRVKGTYTILDILMIAWSILPIMIVLQAIMIPLHLKFGGEKGRIAIVAVFAAFALIEILIAKAADFLNIDFIALLEHLATFSIGMIIAIVMVMVILLMAVSMKISIAVMNKKEF